MLHCFQANALAYPEKDVQKLGYPCFNDDRQQRAMRSVRLCQGTMLAAVCSMPLEVYAKSYFETIYSTSEGDGLMLYCVQMDLFADPAMTI